MIKFKKLDFSKLEFSDPEKKLIKPPQSVRTNLILYGNYENAVRKLEELIEKYKTVGHPKARLRVERYTEQVRELKEYEPYLKQLP